MRMTEILLMRELGLSLTDIESMTPHRVQEYVIIISEIKKMEIKNAK